MNKKCGLFIVSMLLACLHGTAQSDQHYTMFMYNKLLYNPGYTGSREFTSINAMYRKQWTQIEGAPRTTNISVDAPLGTYMRPFRKIAAGFSMGSERIGVERIMNLRAYYAYRVQLKKSVVSLGMSAGSAFYNAIYDAYNPGYPYGIALTDPNDPSFTGNTSNLIMPNFGTGVYWSGKDFYCGLSVPNMLQNYYDRDRGKLTARQIRAVYLSGGYSFEVNDAITIQPQALVRYAMNGKYSLPLNADLNVSAIAYNRLLLGITYRTNGSIAGIVHIQVSKRFNIGYAYDHMATALNSYSGGTHEMVLGYDIVRDNFKFLTPRFIRKF